MNRTDEVQSSRRSMILPAFVVGGIASLLILLASPAMPSGDHPSPRTVDRSEPTADLAAAVSWLWAQQRDDGSWRSDHYAYLRAGHALTPFVLHALLAVPEARTTRPAGGVERALEFIRGTIAADGSVGIEGRDGSVAAAEYPNYATAYTLRCLLAAGDPERDAAAIDRLVARLTSEQYREANGFGPASEVHGGWGFGIRPPDHPGHMDVSITRHVLEALAEAGALARDRSIAERAARFLRLVQRHPADFRPQPPHTGGVRDPRPVPFDGGFYFSPILDTINKGGVATDPGSGRRYYRSYASATAEGALALVALGTPPDDPRLAAARRWLGELHPRIDRHEGIPPDDPNGWRDALRLYHLAVRAEVHARLGGPPGWRAAIARELSRDQREDGSVRNLAGALMKEDDPTLGTALAVIALASCERAGGGR